MHMHSGHLGITFCLSVTRLKFKLDQTQSLSKSPDQKQVGSLQHNVAFYIPRGEENQCVQTL